MSTHFDVNHLVTEWHLWVSDQLDIEVPSLCGIPSRDWDVINPDTGHEIYGSAPSAMCKHCLEIDDALNRASEERDAKADHVLVWDEGKIRAAADVREAL
ncbi:hypothetical protein BO226_02135 [Rhodococcus sp. 2G]|uniref:hypothetical protein n=1 Tax=Rhodococcus sp. 2G TaxID=1570939 RepID=UPI00090443A5|nr:hypothetical protein [Rhodococcus sp. 2G]APE08169.1 hypothetical protein BO226_02135 [Rhodococcus sp. 2G]